MSAQKTIRNEKSSRQTKPSNYLLGQEHITDREIDEIYNFTQELTMQIDEFRLRDKRYRALEKVNTKASETERDEILGECILMIEKIGQVMNEMQEVGVRVKGLFVKAKGALEEKLEMD